jgi:hypothetical protein
MKRSPFLPNDPTFGFCRCEAQYRARQIRPAAVMSTAATADGGNRGRQASAAPRLTGFNYHLPPLLSCPKRSQLARTQGKTARPANSPRVWRPNRSPIAALLPAATPQTPTPRRRARFAREARTVHTPRGTEPVVRRRRALYRAVAPRQRFARAKNNGRPCRHGFQQTAPRASATRQRTPAGRATGQRTPRRPYAARGARPRRSPLREPRPGDAGRPGVNSK